MLKLEKKLQVNDLRIPLKKVKMDDESIPKASRRNKIIKSRNQLNREEKNKNQ